MADGRVASVARARPRVRCVAITSSADYLRDIGRLPVVAGVHIQAEHDYRDHVRETRWLRARRRRPDVARLSAGDRRQRRSREPGRRAGARATCALREHARHTPGAASQARRCRTVRSPAGSRVGSPVSAARQVPAVVRPAAVPAPGEGGRRSHPRAIPTSSSCSRTRPCPSLRDADNVALWSRSIRAYAEHPQCRDQDLGLRRIRSRRGTRRASIRSSRRSSQRSRPGAACSPAISRSKGS